MNIDPELAPALPFLPATDPGDLLASRAETMAMLASLPKPTMPAGLLTEDRTITGPDGNALPLRIFSPSERNGSVPGLVHFHGGGFYLGDLDTEAAPTAAIAAELGVVVVSVDYRLAPEHVFPAAFDDCYAGLVWTGEHAAELGIDPDRLGVMGASAGGNLAAAVALAARDRGGPRLLFQALSIPVLDDRVATPSMLAFSDTPMWNRPMAVASWEAYLGADGGDAASYAAPARETDLTNLPTTYLSTAENDPLRDEGILYALALLQAGVSVELHQFPGTFHASAVVPSAVSTRQAEELTDAIRRGLRL